eukprot:7004831-Alexandrium_andersonii.AAC.1
MFNLGDLEFADDATVVCETARAAQIALGSFQALGAGVGLFLTLGSALNWRLTWRKGLSGWAGDP